MGKSLLRSFDFVPDFGCGLALGCASLTPAKPPQVAASTIVSVYEHFAAACLHYRFRTTQLILFLSALGGSSALRLGFHGFLSDGRCRRETSGFVTFSGEDLIQRPLDPVP